MKYRRGFVSNSSSTAFILDVRKLDNTTLHRVRSLPEMDTWGRDTGSCSDVQMYIDGRTRMDDDWEDYFTEWLQRWVDELGNDNIILCRESDEGMGGAFEDVGLDYYAIVKLAEDEQEYH